MKQIHLIGLVLIFGIVFVIPQLLTPVSNVPNIANEATPTLSPVTPSIVEANPQIQGARTSAYEILEEPSFLVKRVVDGDTIELENGKTVRYIGIDTPETKHPTIGVECFGNEAYEKNRQLVEGKQVVLESDVSQTDLYGRLLRYVYLDGVMVNEQLVKEGYAESSAFPPDVKYQDTLDKAELTARTAQLGLWGTICTAASPSPAVDARSSLNSTGCSIKGNINSTGEKIFHVTGCNDYNKTSIDESKGERWFCSEQEAVNAGWRKAKNCS